MARKQAPGGHYSYFAFIFYPQTTLYYSPSPMSFGNPEGVSIQLLDEMSSHNVSGFFSMSDFSSIQTSRSQQPKWTLHQAGSRLRRTSHQLHLNSLHLLLSGQPVLTGHSPIDQPIIKIFCSQKSIKSPPLIQSKQVFFIFLFIFNSCVTRYNTYICEGK